jgi:hypothetical protein
MVSNRTWNRLPDVAASDRAPQAGVRATECEEPDHLAVARCMSSLDDFRLFTNPFQASYPYGPVQNQG